MRCRLVLWERRADDWSMADDANELIDTSRFERLPLESPIVFTIARLLGEPIADVAVCIEPGAQVISLRGGGQPKQVLNAFINVRGQLQTAHQKLVVDAVLSGIAIGAAMALT